MAGKQLKPNASCCWSSIFACTTWAVNRAIDHGFIIGLELPAHFSPIYCPMGSAATGFFVVFSMIAGVGVASAITGLNHICYLDADSLPTANAAASIVWTFTLLAMGL